MSQFREITPKEYAGCPFREIGEGWMLITAGNREKCNTMTASWGGMGVLWGKNVAFAFIRQTRYTKVFADAEDRLSLTFPGEQYRDVMAYLGKVSGRDEDKIAKSGLTLAYDGDTPYFEEGDRVFICRKLYTQKMEPACFRDASLIARCYADGDYHTVYVCEIEKILIHE